MGLPRADDRGRRGGRRRAGPLGRVLALPPGGRRPIAHCPLVCFSPLADVGFDPLGFSTTITELGGDLTYVREAELMHGRQAMLATVGFVAPALFGKLPVAWTADVSTNPLEAQAQLPPEVFYQVAISIFIAEGLRAQIIFGSDSPPGEHGFDPLG